MFMGVPDSPLLQKSSDTSRSCAVQSFQPVSRKSMGIQGGSSVGDHAWETSFGESDLSDHRNASHCGNNTGPKTMTLFLKRGTKWCYLINPHRVKQLLP